MLQLFSMEDLLDPSLRIVNRSDTVPFAVDSCAVDSCTVDSGVVTLNGCTLSDHSCLHSHIHYHFAFYLTL